MNKTAPVPCIIRTDGIAEEDSLANNTDREALQPLDQFRAFQTLRAKGRGEEEIAAAFGVTAAVIRQRLKLAAISPRLLNVYAERDDPRPVGGPPHLGRPCPAGTGAGVRLPQLDPGFARRSSGC